MEPEPDRVDLSVLDPSRQPARWDAMAGNVAARALELRRLRRAVMRRGMTALALAAAAALLLWFAVPRREVTMEAPAVPHAQRTVDMLDWATRDMDRSDVLDVLELGGNHAH